MGALKHGAPMSKVIGIDLGTTNSCVAVVEPDGSRVLPSRTGQPTTPSVTAVTDTGRRLVGHLAKRQAVTNPGNTIYGVKRLIGRRWDSEDVQRALELVPYRVIAGPHQDVRIGMGDRQYAVPEIASIVLQEMRMVAEKAVGSPLQQAVITVPAYFNDNQRQATKDAGRIAGLDVLRIINEPTAAALAYGFGKGLEQKIAIYDLGGGTFDISILEISQGVFEVLTTSGDTFLGGEDFDERLIDWLVDRFKEEHGIDLRQDRMALQRLREAAERAKIDLSTLPAVEINLPFIYSSPSGETHHLQVQLSRGQLEELVSDLVDKSIEICRQALKRSGLSSNDLDAVILVGGMTRMPLAQHEVERFFGAAPSKGVHPDEVVACGAAIQGHLLAYGDHETLLLDVTPHNLGIMVSGGLFDVVIDKDTTIPTGAKKIFTTTRDDQVQVRIMVLQGGSMRAEENELLGEFLLDGLRRAPRGEVKIKVSFDISADGIVGVSACDVETGREQAITVTASSGLTEDEIREMIAENQEMALASDASDAFEQERLDAERALREVEKLLPRARAVLEGTEFGAVAIRKAEQAMQTVRDAIDKRNKRALQEAREVVQRTALMLRKILERLE